MKFEFVRDKTKTAQAIHVVHDGVSVCGAPIEGFDPITETEAMKYVGWVRCIHCRKVWEWKEEELKPPTERLQAHMGRLRLAAEFHPQPKES